MINKIGVQPSFTSKVNIVYDRNYSVKGFYSSPDMKNQIDALKSNNNDDIVTLLPIPGRYADYPAMDVQVMKRVGEDIVYDLKRIYEPDELLQTYQELESNLNSHESSHVRRDAIIMNYVI